MDAVLELMAKVVKMIYDTNYLIFNLDDKTDLSFIEGAENGLDISKFNLKTEIQVELFKKRKAAFAMNNRIMMMIEELSYDEKTELTDRVARLAEECKLLYLERLDEYQKTIDLITQPEFSFEGNEEIKDRIIELKDQYNRYSSASQYYENMHAYLKAYRKSK